MGIEKISTVKAYKTSDGSLFYDKELAEKHQSALDLREKLSEEIMDVIRSHTDQNNPESLRDQLVNNVMMVLNESH